jgi:type IV secretory pathway VirB10-like protein
VGRVFVRRALAVVVALGLAACGSTTTLHQPPKLGPARGEAEQQPVPAKLHYQSPTGHVSHVQFENASGCGVERWAVKTATDPGASQIDLTPQDTSIAQLDSIAPPINPTDRVAPVETSTYRVQATVTAIKMESDSDYHLAITDGSGNTMIAESASPSCDQGSLLASQIQLVRNTIDQACPNIGPSYQDVSIPATLTGVGFFDRLHGQRGVAPNGIELHPLVAVTLNGKC